MKSCNDKEVRTYDVGDGYKVDVEIKDICYEAWLYNPEYGVKMHMFALLKNNRHYGEFLSIVEKNLSDYIRVYDEEYKFKKK